MGSFLGVFEDCCGGRGSDGEAAAPLPAATPEPPPPPPQRLPRFRRASLSVTQMRRNLEAIERGAPSVHERWMLNNLLQEQQWG